MATPTDGADVATKPLECSPEQKEDNMSTSIWDEMKETAGKFMSSVEKSLPMPEFLDLTDNSLFCSSFDATSHGPVGAPPEAQPAKDLEPKLYEIKKGDTLTSIAKEHLGPDATAKEVQDHVKAIAKLNGIEDANVIHPGKKIELPGHTKDGGTVVIDDEGTKTTQWPDGRLKEEKKDGTGFERVPGADGAYTETHFGPEKADNYVMKVDSAGVITTDDGEGNKVTLWPNGNEIVENKDGTGHFKFQNADGKFSQQYWGPNPEQNYTLEPKADGSYQGIDIAGNTHTRWDDGTEKVEYKDGRGYLSKPDGAGGQDVHHWGPRPEDNFELKKNADGTKEVREKKGDAPHDKVSDEDVQKQRERLHELAEKKITDPGERAKFDADMARFEERSAKMEELYIKQGMSPEEAAQKAKKEVAETYNQISKLMEAPDNPSIKLNERQRVQIAEQVMSNAATPTSINQGKHPTCNVATVECRTYTQNPSEAARLMTEVTTTGEYKTRDGKTVKVDAGSLEPHDQALTHPPIDGQRGHASQIFQVTAVNVHYQRNGGDVRYEQRDAEEDGDNGERLVDYSENPPEVKKAGWIEKYVHGVKDSDYHAPGLSDEQIVDVGSQINGDTGDDWYIRYGDKDSKGSVVNIESQEQLAEKINEAKEKGNLPIVVRVHSGNEPFYTDSGAGRAGGSGGWHVVTITDYDPATGKVAIDNQWGSNVDHPTSKSMISVRDLFLSTRDPENSGQIAELKKDVDHNRSEGKVDYYKEAELLRLQHRAGKLSDEQYKEQLQETIKTAGEKFGEKRAANTPLTSEDVRAWNKMNDLMKNLPSDQRMEVMDSIKTSGFYANETHYRAHLQDAIVTIELQKKWEEKKGKFDDDKKEVYDRTAVKYNEMLDALPQAERERMKREIEAVTKD